jgi:succinoglycan biosynthesis transport protein ExoP
MNDTPRYATLQDYLRVLRRQRWLILAATAIFSAAALGIAVAQTKVYTAEAQLTFRDVVQDLSLIGSNVPSSASSPSQRAAANAALIDRPAMTRRVKKQLHTSMSLGELAGSVSATVGFTTNLVLVHAQSSNRKFAARLANAYADQAVLLGERNLRRRLDAAISNLKREVRQGPSLAHPSFRQGVAQQSLTQLQTIRNIVKPVEVASPAEVPTTPSSPKPVRNTILGALVGLAVGFVLAFARDSLDRRLRGAHEVHEQLNLPVLGRVNETALGFAGAASNGARTPAEVDLEAFRVLRTNLEFLSADAPLRTIAVTSGLPEEGKSTVAASLAGAAAAAGKRTLLVECDLRRSSLAARLGLRPAPGLTDYLVGKAKPREVLQTVELASPSGPGVSSPLAANGERAEQHTGNGFVCIVAGGAAPQPAELLGSRRCQEFLDKVRRAYDLVILDTSPLLSVADALELVPSVDGVIICVRLSQTTQEGALATKAALDRLPPRPTGVVVTGVGRDEDRYGYYSYAYGYSR